MLDFGLAKTSITDAQPGDGSRAPTMTIAGTREGVVLGTASYMSPEQARGQAVDKRTDIWAFGCVLSEMITGRVVFPGATVSDTIARAWNDHPTGPRSRGQRSLLVALTALVAAVVTPVFRKAPAPPEIRFSLLYPRGVAADYAQLAISPDGHQIVAAPNFVIQAPLWLRPLGSTSGRLLTGTEGATFPFWSPDGRSIGFLRRSKVEASRRQQRGHSDSRRRPPLRGGAWQADDTILFAPNAVGPLFRVSAAGGQPTVASKLEIGQNDHRAPFILPDGKHYIYYSRGKQEVRGVHVARLDGTETRRLLDADGAAVYARSGHLLFPRQGQLLAQSFDVTRLMLGGEAFLVADDISVNPGISLAALSASASGPIAYGTESIRRTQFVWFDRSGRRLETLGTPDQRSLANPSLSPDGSRIAFSRVVGGNWDVWLNQHARRGKQTHVGSPSTGTARPSKSC